MSEMRSRIRIRRLIDIPPKETMGGLLSNYWAWSRPHVAEQIERLEIQIREAHRHLGTGLGARQIHQHSIAAYGLSAKITPECNADCLHIDSVTLETPKSEDELDREKVAG